MSGSDAGSDGSAAALSNVSAFVRHFSLLQQRQRTVTATSATFVFGNTRHSPFNSDQQLNVMYVVCQGQY